MCAKLLGGQTSCWPLAPMVHLPSLLKTREAHGTGLPSQAITWCCVVCVLHAEHVTRCLLPPHPFPLRAPSLSPVLKLGHGQGLQLSDVGCIACLIPLLLPGSLCVTAHALGAIARRKRASRLRTPAGIAKHNSAAIALVFRASSGRGARLGPCRRQLSCMPHAAHCELPCT